MLIRAFLAQTSQRLLKLVQILPILTARSAALHDLLRQCLRVLGSEELWVVWQTDVYETFDRVRDVCWLCVAGWCDALHRGAHVLPVVEGRVLDGVAVDLADVEVFFHFGDVGGWDAVGCAPDSRGCGGVLWGWERVSLGSSAHHCVSKSTVDWSLT